MTHFLTDVRFALRALTRQPTFTLIALLTLTLGIGANTAIFSVIKAVLLNPLPYDAPEEIVVLWEVNPDGSLEQVSIPTYLDWQEQAQTLDAVAAYRRVDFSYTGSAEPRNVSGVRATPELFQVLHAGARLGRTFVEEEAVMGQDRVVVLSHGFWERTLGGRDGVVGTAIELDANPYTVVGVMPPGFRVSDQRRRGGLDAACVQPERRPRPFAPLPFADGRRPCDLGIDARAGARGVDGARRPDRGGARRYQRRLERARHRRA